jgi:hypothetical protein
MIWEAHYSQVVGHFGMETIVEVLKNYLYWKKLLQDVIKYIKPCIACTILKPTIKKHGIYTPLPTPDRPWDSISMDYMSSIPSTKHGYNDVVFIFVDIFSKMAVLTPCKKSITVEAIYNLFFECFWDHFGLPKTIISYPDSDFLSTFLVYNVVIDGHQAHQINFLPPPN